MPDCRGRVRTDSEGRFGYRAVVPVAYPIPNDVCRHFIRVIQFFLAHSFVGIRAPWLSCSTLSTDTTSARTTFT
jgi:protocatechuate 3,4-dioxygenase beta subunit